MKIEIPHDAKKIGVLCSGGVDSTLLLYLLVKQNLEQNLNLEIQAFTMHLKNTDKYNVTKSALSWIENHFGVSLYFSNVGKEIKRLIRNAVSDIILVMNTDYVYTGCNKVIWDENEFVITKVLPNDTPPVRGNPLNDKHLRPFIDIDKIEITKVYFDNDIMDLFRLTRSCGYQDGYINPCGGCYFCMERKWALEKLNLKEN